MDEKYKSHVVGYFRKTNFAITFSKILPSWLTPVLTRVSYSQVEELRVMNEDQEGQTLNLGDVTPGLAPHISNKYKNSSLGMSNPPHSDYLDNK
jgi:hypothetical protein